MGPQPYSTFWNICNWVLYTLRDVLIQKLQPDNFLKCARRGLERRSPDIPLLAWGASPCQLGDHRHYRRHCHQHHQHHQHHKYFKGEKKKWRSGELDPQPAELSLRQSPSSAGWTTSFLDALTSLGSMLESQWVSHSCFLWFCWILGISSGYLQGMFRVCSE